MKTNIKTVSLVPEGSRRPSLRHRRTQQAATERVPVKQGFFGETKRREKMKEQKKAKIRNSDGSTLSLCNVRFFFFTNRSPLLKNMSVTNSQYLHVKAKSCAAALTHLADGTDHIRVKKQNKTGAILPFSLQFVKHSEALQNCPMTAENRCQKFGLFMRRQFQRGSVWKGSAEAERSSVPRLLFFFL